MEVFVVTHRQPDMEQIWDVHDWRGQALNKRVKTMSERGLKKNQREIKG